MSGTLDERLYIIQDANFNETGLMNTSGSILERYDYTPFGSPNYLNSSWSPLSDGSEYAWSFLHQGGELSAGGVYSFRNREYSSTLGRWLQNDPIGFKSNDVNLYRYSQNLPNNYVDPFGLDEIHWKLEFGIDSVSCPAKWKGVKIEGNVLVGTFKDKNGDLFELFCDAGGHFVVKVTPRNGIQFNWGYCRPPGGVNVWCFGYDQAGNLECDWFNLYPENQDVDGKRLPPSDIGDNSDKIKNCVEKAKPNKGGLKEKTCDECSKIIGGALVGVDCQRLVPKAPNDNSNKTCTESIDYRIRNGKVVIYRFCYITVDGIRKGIWEPDPTLKPTQ
jgi:RHS repeat-associated protein